MSGEDQERFEDYLELEQFVEELQAGHVAHPPTELTPGQARIYRMAALFRSASPEAAEPRPEFAEALRARLEQEIQQQRQQQSKRTKRFPFLGKKQEQGEGTANRNGRTDVSRRRLLAGGAAVAASLVAGVAIGHEIEAGSNNKQGIAGSKPAPWSEQLIAADQPTTWFFVTTVAELGSKVIRFTSETIVGYVTFDDGDDGDPDKGKIIAMSAACTHMGCIVQWQASDKKFHCPCHGGTFAEYGKPDPRSPLKYLNPLPRLNTKVVDGNIYVEVPAIKQPIGHTDTVE